MPTACLELRDLACERDDRVLFEGLDLSVDAGRIVQVRGANGTGKTTLLRCIAGLHVDYQGSIRIAGKEGDDAREELFFFGHRPAVSAGLSARENLAWFVGLAGARASAAEIADALAQVGLRGWDEVSCQAMSAGQQRRVALARLVLEGARAPLWLLDEPFTALDDLGVAVVVALMDDHRARGGSVLFATHQTAPGLDDVATLQMHEPRAGLVDA